MTRSIEAQELRDILVRRLVNSAPAIVTSMSAKAIQLALESAGPTDLIQVLAQWAFHEPGHEPRSGVRIYPAIDVQLKRQLAEAAGGLLGATEAKQRSGLASKAKLDRAVKERRTLAVEHAGRQRYPAFQFDLGADADALVALLRAAPELGGWQILQYLFTAEDGQLCDKPINLVRR